MTFTAAGPVASGCLYVVTDVAGRSPAGLDDFVGDIAFTVRKGDQSCQVSGTGGRTGPGVRFNQKDGNTGRDLRVWQITATTTEGFQAQPISGTGRPIIH